jgi:colicin import membrane protein
MNELIVADDIKAVITFDKAIVDEYLKKLRERELSVVGDISTDAGRKELASRAYKIAQQKNEIKRAADALKEDHQKVIKEINKESGRIWEEMEAIQHEVRKPLTEWENIEKERVAAHEAALKIISVDLVNLNPDDMPELFERNLNELAHIEQREWQEFSGRAEEAIKHTRKYLSVGYDRRVRELADAAELAELRRKQAEQEQKDREAKIAAEAAAKAKADAEAEADRQRIAIERKAKEEADKAEATRVRLEKEKKDAEELAEKTRLAGIEAARKAEADRIAAEAYNKKVLEDFKEQSRLDAEAAALAERNRQEAEKKALAEEEENATPISSTGKK